MRRDSAHMVARLPYSFSSSKRARIPLWARVWKRLQCLNLASTEGFLFSFILSTLKWMRKVARIQVVEWPVVLLKWSKVRNVIKTVFEGVRGKKCLTPVQKLRRPSFDTTTRKTWCSHFECSCYLVHKKNHYYLQFFRPPYQTVMSDISLDLPSELSAENTFFLRAQFFFYLYLVCRQKPAKKIAAKPR